MCVQSEAPEIAEVGSDLMVDALRSGNKVHACLAKTANHLVAWTLVE